MPLQFFYVELQAGVKGHLGRHNSSRAPGVKLINDVYANPEFGVELQPIDFAKVAEACGVVGFTLENPKDAERVLSQALRHDGPAVVEAVVDANEPPLPGKIKTEQAVHLAEALASDEKDGTKIIKAVLRDKVREVI